MGTKYLFEELCCVFSSGNIVFSIKALIGYIILKVCKIKTCNTGMLQQCCKCVVASLGSCDFGSGSGIGTVWGFGHHGSSRVLAVRHDMSSRGDQRSGNITSEKIVKELE